MSLIVSDHMDITLFDVKKVQYQSRVIFDYIQSCYTVSFIKQGEVITTCEGKEYVAKSGDVMIHRPHTPFNVISRTDGIHYLFNVDLKVKENEDFFQICPMDKVIKIRDPQLYEKKFDELRSIWLQEIDELRTAQSGFLALFLLHEIIESSKVERRSAREAFEIDRFNKALHYMEKRLDQNITREELANLYHMNPVYFSRAFKKIYGITPSRMLHKLRLLHAKRMLEDPELSIEYIAQKNGYYDAAHFNRTFQKAFKMSPNKFRKSIKYTKSRIEPTLFGDVE
ncbi:AraC family transcriptional regulator [Paenibacillus sp. GD4]|jgi:AraC-like DNA-binding protein|uniref:helix-turn-helix domain-containing protein n=1 Tax=Paenibacillus sp. GD4 TaxID=3068890 RepID=UPI0027968619|nr:helix-turn-helix domain-containing protein [Paenibacillus sp. GD4]MDQ1914767.1 AraC family transcriptional regulator [Paenibacillus sp. GD4]